MVFVTTDVRTKFIACVPTVAIDEKPVLGWKSWKKRNIYCRHRNLHSEKTDKKNLVIGECCVTVSTNSKSPRESIERSIRQESERPHNLYSIYPSIWQLFTYTQRQHRYSISDSIDIIHRIIGIYALYNRLTFAASHLNKRKHDTNNNYNNDDNNERYDRLFWLCHFPGVKIKRWAAVLLAG